VDLITVLVVDDSAFMRKVISDIINSDPLLQVVSTARNGQEALLKINLHQPDVVTLDIEMPEMDGLTALEILMSTHPLPVVMVSNLTQVGAEATIRALQLGAVDFIPKPSGQISLDIGKLSDEIINKIKVAATARVTLQEISPDPDLSQIQPNLSLKQEINYESHLNKLIVIGASTGGPKALNQVLSAIPADIDAALLIVQHMPAGFTKSLANRLNAVSQIRVKEAEEGEPILTGCAYIAPGDYHLRVYRQKLPLGSRLVVKLGHDSPRGGHRPSVDEMLFSVAKQFWGPVVGVIMTGMGQDGTAGLKLMQARGAQIIAEHQSTCVVYGMPRAAIESGYVNQVVPLPEITPTILKLL
jgi:two-component system chemotaxis response regulator CheB